MKQLVVLIAVLVLIATACSSGSADRSMTLYSGRSEDLVQPLIDAFTEETGISVTVKYAGSTDLATTILEEGDASPADVFFAQDPASLGTVALSDLFDVLPSEIVDAVPARFSDDQGRWVGTSGRARVAVYDSTLVSPSEMPPTEDGFGSTEWDGRVGIAPSNGSFLAFVAAKILVDGEAKTRTWLEAMAANNAQKYPNNSSIVAAVNAGEIEAGLVNHYYLLRALAENPDDVGANFFFPSPTAGSLVMPAGAGVLSSSDHKDEAIEFIEWLRTAESQTYFAQETFEYPLVPGIPASALLPPIDSIPTPDLNLSDLAAVLDLATDLVAEAGLL